MKTDTKSTLVINGFYRVDADDVEKFSSILLPHIAETITQEGCNYYSFSTDLDDPTTFRFAEGWRDRAALDAHLSSESFQKTLAEILQSIRILDRDAQLYTVAHQEFIPVPTTNKPEQADETKVLIREK